MSRVLQQSSSITVAQGTQESISLFDECHLLVLFWGIGLFVYQLDLMRYNQEVALFFSNSCFQALYCISRSHLLAQSQAESIAFWSPLVIITSLILSASTLFQAVKGPAQVKSKLHSHTQLKASPHHITQVMPELGPALGKEYSRLFAPSLPPCLSLLGFPFGRKCYHIPAGLTHSAETT